MSFIAALERTLGKPEEVEATYRAWLTANEVHAGGLNGTTFARAVRWPKAYLLAAEAALAGTDGAEELAFEIRLFPQPA
ncbi:hypothetical protein EZ313_22010 [Ramlibacter henchirensis]|uniref:Uncharacterized protein n=1 Tax=Ramlibacter henchirensis TaxID=204072 RepID=A0A4Z0BMC9_9BURK|nr:hypothetical protein [Ramlibacter henchirensis]TFY99244.1 hypothetical protein EZ313_22010 [Ramlibacter henchirensis]